MSLMMLDQHELDRLNIQTAWQFSHRLSADAFEQLCRVTVASLRHVSDAPEREPRHVW